jgi:HK97 family phage prohead protease
VKIEFVAVPVTLDAAAGEDSPRTITGVAVPWDTPAVVSGGQKVQFARGSFNLEQKAPKLLEGHDMNQLRGVVTEMVEAEEGLLFTAKFAKTRASDEAIELIKAGAYDSVSIGAVPTKFKYKGDTMMVSAAEILEISLVSHPAFSASQITEIAASQPDEESEEEVVEPQPQDISEEETMSTDTPTVEASAEIVPTAPLFAAAKRVAKLPTAAEYIAAAMAGGDQWLEMSEALRAAAPDVTTTDTPGILPMPIVQPVYNNFIGFRPVVDAIGAKAMPGSGKVFIRPEVTTHVSMAAQSAENAALQSGTYVVTDNQVTKGTYGGYVNLSLQDESWSDPAVVQLILDDMARIYANTTDNVAADNLLSGQTQTRALTDPASPSEWVTDIFAAAQTILTNSNGNLPTHLFLAPNMWASLGLLTDTTGRPLFPQVGPMNAFGTIQANATDAVAFGLRIVVDRNFAADTVIVGDPTGFEIFEQARGALTLESPSTLSRVLSFSGTFATLMIDPTKFVSLT